MGRPAVAVEALQVGISVEMQRLDLLDPGREQPVNDVSGKVEMRLARHAGREEAGVGAVGLDEADAEAVVDLVGLLGNAWADGGGNALALFFALRRVKVGA